MKLRFVTALATVGMLSFGYAAQPANSNANTVLKTEKDKLSYSLGVMTGQTFRSHAVDIDANLFARGFSDAMANKKTLLSEKQVQQIVRNFQLENQQKARQKMLQEAKSNLAKGQKFLAENKEKPGIVTLKSGLQYKVIRAGDGAQPGPTDVVTVNYEGRLLDGKIFDSSYKRGVPASFQLNQVIKGWQDALQKMHVGAKWELYIPAKLAYGEQGSGGVIGPNQVLIFTVELLSVKKSK